MRPKDFTSLEIDELISARNYLFEQKPFPLKILSEIIQKLLEKTSWVNGSDLTDDLIKLTGSKDLNDAEKALAEWKKEISEKPPEPTVPQNREELEKERVLREKQAAESKVAAKIKTEQFIKAQEKLYLNLPKKINIPEITPEDEGKLHELIVDKVRPNPTFYTDSLAKEIIKQNKTLEMSRGEVNILKANAKLVAITHTNNLLSLESKEETIGSVARLVWAKNPLHVATSLANPENPIVGKETARSAQITALTLEHDNLIARKFLSKVVDPKILPFFYPGSNELIIYEVSDKENKETILSVDKKAFTNQGIKLEESNNQIFNFIKENLWGEIKNRSWGFLDKTLDYTPWYSKAKSLVPDFLKPKIPIFAAGETVRPGLSLLWSKQGIQLLSTDMPTLLSSSFGKNIFLTPSFGLQFGKFITTEGVTGQFFGVNYGNFGVNLIHYGEEKGLRLLINLRIVEGLPRVAAAEEVGTVSGKLAATAIEKGVATGATKVGAEVVAKTAAGAAAKTGLSALFAKIGATISSIIPIPILSQILGAIVGWISGKIIEPIILWIKKHQEDLKIVGLIMLGGGMIMRSLPLMVFGGLVFVPLAIRNGLSMAGIAARTTFLFGRIGASMAITIGTPIIIAIIVFPILVAIILFIINSGAYIVPPSSPGLNFESPYIGVDKTANPPGPFQNSDLPLTIEYTITITAKKGTLTNLHFSESCQVIKKGASVNCPSITGGIPQSPESISPTTPFSFKYSVTYAAETFADSLVVNSFTVTADAAGVSGVKGVGSTSIKIGNPPEDCPNNAWPVESNGGLNNVTQGPSAPGCTHENLPNAIDIGVDGAVVIAVHSGIVTVGEDSCTGKTIKISSTCGSVPFSSFYGHLGAVTVSTGQKVSVGQAIGISDNTGSCTSGPHLHFSFQTSSIPKVQRPYLIRDIPIGCCSISTCNP